MRGEGRVGRLDVAAMGLLALTLGVTMVVGLPSTAGAISAPFTLTVTPSSVLNAAQGQTIPIDLTIVSLVDGLTVSNVSVVFPDVCGSGLTTDICGGFGHVEIADGGATFFDDVATFNDDLGFLFNPITLDNTQNSGPLHFGDLVLTGFAGDAPIGTDIVFTAKWQDPADPKNEVTVDAEFRVTQGPIAPPNPGQVPEPSSLLLLGAGLLGASVARRRRR